jgi:hypothetical protein
MKTTATPKTHPTRDVLTKSRLMVVARALNKAGSVTVLAEALDVSRNAIYAWCDFHTSPSKELMEALQDYLNEIPKVVAPAPAPVALPPAAPTQMAELLKVLTEKKPEQAEPKKNYNLPIDMEVHPVVVQRHAYAKSGARIIFGSTVDTGERVFVPPHTTDKLLKKLDGVIPIDTVFKAQLARDISGRSDFIAQEVV